MRRFVCSECLCHSSCQFAVVIAWHSAQGWRTQTEKQFSHFHFQSCENHMESWVAFGLEEKVRAFPFSLRKYIDFLSGVSCRCNCFIFFVSSSWKPWYFFERVAKYNAKNVSEGWGLHFFLKKIKYLELAQWTWWVWRHPFTNCLWVGRWYSPNRPC